MQIPRTIHQIWIGSQHYTERLKICKEQLLECNSNWELKIWTNSSVDYLLNLPFGGNENHPLSDRVKKHWLKLDRTRPERTQSFKADLLRMLIVYHFGGVYVDNDVFFLKNLDNAIDSKQDFILAKIKDNPLFIAEAVIGATPKHPIMLQMIDMYCGKDVDGFGVISPNLSRFVADRKLGKCCADTEVFIPHQRQEFSEEALYRFTDKTVGIHLWYERDYEYQKLLDISQLVRS